jgi:protoheme IX farnesyltransferase
LLARTVARPVQAGVRRYHSATFDMTEIEIPANLVRGAKSHPFSARRCLELARAFVSLTKPRIIELLLVTTVPTMLLAERGVPPARLLAATLAGGAFAAGGANALNMFWDRDIDAKMSRTKRRPIVTGAVPPGAAVLFGLALEAAAFALLATEANLLAASLAVAAAAFYVGVYTALLKRRTPQNIVIGGAAGAAPALVGWAAVTGGLSPVAWGLFGVIFLWTPPHFWALAVRYRVDYSGAGVPMLPSVMDVRRVANRVVAYAVVLTALTVALAPIGHLGAVYLGGALVFGAGFVAETVALRLRPTPKWAMAVFHGSITYLSLLFVLVGIVALVHK